MCVLMLMMMMSLTLVCAETNDGTALPDLQIPDPPASAEGDEEIVETTVGAMRNALFYYHLVPILLDHIDTVETVAIREAEKVDVERRLKEAAQQEAKRWKRRTIYVGSAAAIATALATILSLTR